METTTFSIDWTALGAVLGFLGALLLLLRIRFQEPHISYSEVTPSSGFLKSRFSPWPTRLFYLSLAAFLTAFIDPHWMIPRHPDQLPPGSSLEGIAIYLVLDQSGSMQDKAAGTGLPKIELLKQMTRAFVQGDPQEGLRGRSQDLIGVVAFARSAQVLVPLTSDHRAVVEALAHLQANTDPEQDGTSIGYAIYKTANLIVATRHYASDLAGEGKPAYDIKSTVMILVTDGLQDPSLKDQGKRLRTMDIPEAAAFAKEHGIRLYIVNVEPAISQEQFSANRNQMERASESTGGRFFLMGGGTTLAAIYKQIDSLEKSHLPGQIGQVKKENLPSFYKKETISPYLIALGLASLFVGIFIQAILLKRVP